MTANTTRHRRNAQHLETFSGLLIAMTVLVLGVTVHAEVTGRPALKLVGVLVLLLVADVVVVKAARSQRARAEDR
ncbi:hypothetical protein [Kineococcus aurantiacus]|uniref:Membrane protein YdbS with pleckstrin-like domain n=1 Tax=Kineococcus aurantiacus TaxID=37633 RepID=A0A7Y9DLH5_9ACTN|nr:hypothetical protein [Kineococcus aurantiacus]NYD22711.1 membrane protein YdbS with pleckstrin-like domain [Kineococcus aurantiacus]